MNFRKLDKLPNHVADEVMETLKYWTGCTATRENGKWRVVAATGISTTERAADYLSIDFSNTDFYTPDEISEYAKQNPSNMF